MRIGLPVTDNLVPEENQMPLLILELTHTLSQAREFLTWTWGINLRRLSWQGINLLYGPYGPKKTRMGVSQILPTHLQIGPYVISLNY